MKSGKIVPQPRVFPFHPRHVDLADNLVTIWDEAWIDRPSIRDVEVALPSCDNCPQRFKRLGTMIPQHPS